MICFYSLIFFVIFANIMPNTFFRFRNFIVHQDKCVMKVGTDSVLIGAWAHGGKRILDVGTGTGVVAMMMAQRFVDASVDAVDIDADACSQAMENVAESPFADRVRVWHMAVQHLAEKPELQGAYQAIVSNPPFFENALKAPGLARNMARHTDALPFAELFASARRLLAKEGEFSVIIPFNYRSRLEAEASLCGFFLSRVCAVRTTPAKPPKRYMLAFRQLPVDTMDYTEGLLETAPGMRSPWYQTLTADFYL